MNSGIPEVQPGIRPFRIGDHEALRALIVDSFSGVTLEQNVGELLGDLNGHDWRWRKARHVDEDIAVDPDGIFVAESAGTLVGAVTTRKDVPAGRGRIVNLAVAAPFRGQGLGRALIEHALEAFRAAGLSYAVIETMAHNEVGRHLYPACGFIEVARQIHYARRL